METSHGFVWKGSQWAISPCALSGPFHLWPSLSLLYPICLSRVYIPIRTWTGFRRFSAQAPLLSQRAGEMRVETSPCVPGKAPCAPWCPPARLRAQVASALALSPTPSETEATELWGPLMFERGGQVPAQRRSGQDGWARSGALLADALTVAFSCIVDFIATDWHLWGSSFHWLIIFLTL